MLAKKIALGFGLAIIFPMMIHYGVSTFSPEPKFESYAKQEEFNKTATAQEKVQKEEARESAQKQFEKHLYMVAVPLGLVAILIGAFSRVQSIGSGLMIGGIFSITDGYINYWNHLEDWMRFLSLLAAFVILLIVGYKKIEKA
jgi:predicted histidine transporter YuiF (NhaC family)